jgi:hypothetical protein
MKNIKYIVYCSDKQNLNDLRKFSKFKSFYCPDGEIAIVSADIVNYVKSNNDSIKFYDTRKTARDNKNLFSFNVSNECIYKVEVDEHGNIINWIKKNP